MIWIFSTVLKAVEINVRAKLYGAKCKESELSHLQRNRKTNLGTMLKTILSSLRRAVIPLKVVADWPATVQLYSAISSVSRCFPSCACVRWPATRCLSWRPRRQRVLFCLDAWATYSRAVHAAAEGICRSSAPESAENLPAVLRSSSAVDDTSATNHRCKKTFQEK